jgi:hypothetical protein
LYIAEDSFNEAGKLVNLQLELKAEKKPSPAVVILLISNDHSGKLVNCQLLLKDQKKEFPAVVI